MQSKSIFIFIFLIKAHNIIYASAKPKTKIIYKKFSKGM